MIETVPLPLSEWESFYVIIGSSAAALTGLMFVVIALGADAKATSGEVEINTFGTPIVVHFCAALLVSAALSAPWHSVSRLAFTLGACGVGGVGYLGVVFRRARRTMAYKPVAEDWVWHVVLPAIAYVALVVASVRLTRDLAASLFEIGVVTLLLLFIGIHNAWDAAVWMASGRQGSS